MANGVPYSFSSTTGTPLHVVTAFLSLVRRSQNFFQANETVCVVIVFDSPMPTSNHELSPEYKANRIQDFSQEARNPFIHLPLIKKALTALQLSYIEIPGVEADDIIATLATRFTQSDSDNRAYIVSSDTDFYQLVEERIGIVKHSNKGIIEILDTKSIQEKVGVNPSHYVYFKSLTGDRADNIPGIPSIGPIRAKRIISGKLAIDLSPYQALLSRNMQLIQMNIAAPVQYTFEEMQYNPIPLYPNNKALFHACGF